MHYDKHEILINDKSREEYLKMGSGEKVNFIKIIESIIKKDIDMKFLKEIKIDLNKKNIHLKQQHKNI